MKPEIHPNHKNETGSPVNTGGKHSAEQQPKGNDDGIPMTTENAGKFQSHSSGETPKGEKSQSFTGNNDPDANRTEQPA